MTDKDEILANTWIPHQAQDFAAFSEQAIARARALGAERTWLLGGPVLRPGFFERDVAFAARLAKRLKLDQSRTCVLVFFGGYASPKMLSLAKALARVEQPIEVLFLCGHSDRLRRELERLETPYPKRALGFVRRVDHLMELAEVMIGKPGPGAAFEAVAKGLTLLLELNRTTLRQERANAEFIAAKGYGMTFRDDEELVTRLAGALQRHKPKADSPDSPFRSDREIRKALTTIYDEIAQEAVAPASGVAPAEEASA